MILLKRDEKTAEKRDERVSASSHVNLWYLKTPEKTQRLQLHENRLLQKLSHMEKKIKDVMQKEAVEIDETTASDLQTIMAEEKKQVDSLFPDRYS